MGYFHIGQAQMFACAENVQTGPDLEQTLAT